MGFPHPCNLNQMQQCQIPAAAFFRFLRQPSSPNAPRPVAKSGSAASSGRAKKTGHSLGKASSLSPGIAIVNRTTLHGEQLDAIFWTGLYEINKMSLKKGQIKRWWRLILSSYSLRDSSAGV